jgi:hypothetical protein
LIIPLALVTCVLAARKLWEIVSFGIGDDVFPGENDGCEVIVKETVLVLEGKTGVSLTGTGILVGDFPVRGMIPSVIMATGSVLITAASGVGVVEILCGAERKYLTDMKYEMITTATNNSTIPGVDISYPKME